MRFLPICLLFFLAACSTDDEDTSPPNSTYFPPLDNSAWEQTTPASLGWNNNELEDLKTFLEQNGTRAFIVLVDGKIVVEEYWNMDLQGQPFGVDNQWYWASAGKSLAASLIGIAQQEGQLSLNDPTADYLGSGWTSMPAALEEQIQIKHQLSMSTGLEFEVTNLDCTDPSCLSYRNDPDTQWYYHNAPYLLLHDVLESATGVDVNTFTQSRIGDRIGMSGQWLSTALSNRLFVSTARDAARFGLLALHQGNWNGHMVIDNNFMQEAVVSSQNLNPSYGYLWWLNGKESVIFPGATVSVPSSVTPAAPADMFSALGKNGQIIDVIPSQNMVVVRMGESASNDLVPVLFHDQIWQRLQQVMP
ncbi:serine hydrolase domain-containing protein [Nonlabens xiamenensis]|uniref:serine hydrolase domain-containing protein n=1 Tax=Nonlabens xiamenensis TaxID=2341043 RepID=UPI000F60AD0C|nr:serine hydrolase [Nonlabens xiamenensis]